MKKNDFKKLVFANSKKGKIISAIEAGVGMLLIQLVLIYICTKFLPSSYPGTGAKMFVTIVFLYILRSQILDGYKRGLGYFSLKLFPPSDKEIEDYKTSMISELEEEKKGHENAIEKLPQKTEQEKQYRRKAIKRIDNMLTEL